jgi:Flp pilus assembly CpaE family ATPase
VIDAGSTLDERVLNVLEAVETIVLPVSPEMSALRSVHELLDYLTQEGTLSAKATFVLNNVFAREILKRRDIEAALGTRITTDLPYDPFLYLKAVNEGVPIVIGAPRSPAAEQLAKLSINVFGEDVLEVVANQPRKGGLFGLRRRS